MRVPPVARPLSTFVLLFASAGASAAVWMEPAGDAPPPISDVSPTLVGRTKEGLVAPVPLVHTAVEVDVRGLVAATTVTQVYANTTAHPLETTYVFPLPPGAAVYAMEARIRDTVVRSVVKEKGEARKVFEAARAEGRRAALLEQQRPNLFTMALANVMPGDRVDVTLRYVEQLPWDNGVVRVTFPTVAGPRFIPPDAGGGVACLGGGMVDTENIASPVAAGGAGHDLSFRLRADMGGILPHVSSPTHRMQVDTVAGTGAVEVELEEGVMRPDRDVVVALALPRSDVLHAAMFVSPGEGDAHFMLSVFPPAERPADRRPAMDWLVVVDVSGSMQGPSMEQAREALAASFDRMRPGDRFNLVAYNHTFWAHAPAPVPVTAEHVEKARAWVNHLEANGGTMLLPALEFALKQPAEDNRLRYVVVMTDGDMGNEEQVLASVRQHLGGARLFTVAVGSAPNHFLAQKMADLGRGSFTAISSGTEIKTRMAELLDRIESPVLADIRLAWTGASVDDVYPLRTPDLFLGAPLVVFGRVKGEGGTLTVHGQRGRLPVKQVVPFDVARADFHPGITTLWARRVVEDMMDTYRQVATEAEREQVRDNVVAHAIRHHLVTQFTSLVAVEEKVVNPGGQSVDVRVPVELPHGMNADMVLANPRGGTADTFLRLLAVVLLALGLLVHVSTRRRAVPCGA